MALLRRWCSLLLLALFSFSSVALAEYYEGKTAALSTVTVCSEETGAVEAVRVLEGQRVEAGETLVQLRPERTFASQDGTVSLVNAAAGDTIDGTVLEIMPTERYTIYCTVDKAYQSAASTLVHSGETVYIKCTKDGTHRAVGIITQIDGEEYRVLTLGGELYVGETVYLYRDDAFTTAQRVGIGTVVVSDTQAYEADGKLTRLLVAAGDEVERGQLLFETDGGAIAAPTSGIITSVSCQAGEAVEENQAVAELVPDGEIGVEIQMDETEAARVSIGDAALLTLAGQEDEDAIPGTVVAIAGIAESDQYTVRIRPQTDQALPLNMSVGVRVEIAIEN